MEVINYNPDVLTCLANLSNDEVFTPPVLANELLDRLPAEIWSDETITFLDPVSKSGVFLREISKRLNIGLESKFPDLKQRLNHIYHNQVFGIAITDLTALLSRRSVYCSKIANGDYSIVEGFKNENGNILFHGNRHTWINGKCEYCGASEMLYSRSSDLESHAYEFIHTKNPQELFNMKFDVIIGNPPYQLKDGGGTGSSAKPIYHLFIEQAMKLNPRYLTMIVPSRWYSGGKGLDNFRKTMLTDKRIEVLVDYSDARDCFPNVDIAGGVCYFLWNTHHSGKCNVINIRKSNSTKSTRHLDEFDSFIRDSAAADIIKEIGATHSKFLDSVVSSRNPFGLSDKIRSSNSGKLTLISSQGTCKVRHSDVSKGHDIIEKWKVFVSKASYDHGGQPNKDGKRRILARIFVGNPNTICSETYLVAGSFDNRKYAVNFANFLRTSFARFLIGSILLTQNVTKGKFQFVPELDWKESWTDEKLFSVFKLSTSSIDLIHSTIIAMEQIDE